MVALHRFLILSLPAASSLFAAQLPRPQEPRAGGSTQQVFHVEDGGVRGTLESLVIPPKAEAPFTLTLATEWVQSLSDGGTITLVNQRRIARDSKGRIYQERWLLVPKNGKVESKMNVIQIADPNSHTLYNCFFDGKNICRVSTYLPSTNAVYKMDGPPSGPLPNDSGWLFMRIWESSISWG